MGLQSHSSPQRSYFGCCEFRSPGFPFQLWHIGPSPPWPTSGFTAVRRTALVPVARFTWKRISAFSGKSGMLSSGYLSLTTKSPFIGSQF